MEGLKLQSLLFEKIETQIGQKENLVNEVAKVLSLSPNTAYKRIKGITALNLDDLVKLSSHFKISLDNIILSESDSIVFQFGQLKSQPKSYSEYLEPIVQLSHLTNHFPKEDFQLYYATNELPLFHYVLFNELNFFKYYTWAWAIWEIDNTKNHKLSFEKPIDSKDQFLLATEKIKDSYFQIESTEFLSRTALHNTIQQIKYFASINRFERKEDALSICNSLRKLFEHMFNMAEAGKKFKPNEQPTKDSPNYHLFHNEITQSNNLIVVETPVGNHTFATYDNPNLIHTEDKRMTQYTIDWFHKLKKNSIPLSRETQKNRIKFFDLMLAEISKAEEEIKVIFKTMND